ncbi:hypothetical protein OS493_026917 [Desmophyllum pertusum]|uniref:Uncharacterized protein n=1 Tax=Desmophyllum pertusum TaxID=174260 RepID=A0A9W9Z060_9CNID|nr:hypothetical protein OS493_026917 [Desmophyllum pertusum]
MLRYRQYDDCHWPKRADKNVWFLLKVRSVLLSLFAMFLCFRAGLQLMSRPVLHVTVQSPQYVIIQLFKYSAILDHFKLHLLSGVSIPCVIVVIFIVSVVKSVNAALFPYR